jgi:hypothetical protein
MRRNGRAWGRAIPILALLWLVPAAAGAVESPTSYGAAARVDTPILRIPQTAEPPTIDGVMEEGEWEDAAALGTFWYDYAQADFRFLAPIQTNLQLYSCFDKEHLYFCFTSPIYPENSWLKARGRFPDVFHHPQYGLQWDDHHELELRPYSELAKGFQMGLLRWDVNPINNYADWYWTTTWGPDFTWTSGATIRSQTDGERWVVEYRIPLEKLRVGHYDKTDENGEPIVKLPPADGTIYRAWFTRSIGGNGPLFNVFDAHIWNTTKTQVIFDSRAPSFQLNELGPIMEDVVDVRLTVKNHNTRSETLRIGFFVESAEGLVYTSYEDPVLNEGLVELRPGEVKELRLQQPFPGISRNGNVLWLDIRAAGRPAKILHRTRLVRFHHMEGGAVTKHVSVQNPDTKEWHEAKKQITFRERRLDVIETLRPPRKDFELTWNWSDYEKQLAVVVDKGIHGASEEARRAVEAKVLVMKDTPDEDIVAERMIPFTADFAVGILPLPEVVNGESYKFGLLLFDENKRIVGERNPDPFTYTVAPWMGNEIGKEDVVWEPFVPMEVTEEGFRTLKHTIRLAPSGLPAQIVIHPDERELPLEIRGTDAALPEEELVAMGRGPQLRAPVRLRAVAGGEAVPVEVVTPAERIRTWKSELEYRAELTAGGLPITLVTRYDCDGSMYCRLAYGGEAPVALDRLELVIEPRGTVDLMISDTGHGGMAGADKWECTLPAETGVLWDSTQTEMELYYSRFVPYFWFGSADRGWTWYCDRDRGWELDRDGSAMQLERHADGAVTWSTQFVNHPTEVRGRRAIDFAILTHPTKPKPANYRRFAWHYFAGKAWAAGYQIEPADLSEAYLKEHWHQAAQAPKEMPYSQAREWRKDEPPYYRYGQWRNVGVCPELDRVWEDKGVYLFSRQIRVGRRVGWWMDEYWPVGFGASENLAAGNAYLRDPEEVRPGELPYHRGFNTQHMRDYYKRLARVSKQANVPQRQHTWSNNAATMLESYIYNSFLVEGCGATHRSYEIDVVTQYPRSLYQYESKSYAGLAATVCPDNMPIRSGDDKRIDRQLAGRGLLYDIGFTPTGPHGTCQHPEQIHRLLRRLQDFGFFEDENLEMLPYWRNGHLVRYGEAPPPPVNGVYVTAYRRPLAEREGYKAIFVLMNEGFDPVTESLTILDPERVLGGPNTLAAETVYAQAAMPEGLRAWWQGVGPAVEGPVLRDFETDEIIARRPGEEEVYGPVEVGYHDFRILYAEFAAE